MKWLRGPQLAPIEKEYRRTKKSPKHMPEWFSLFDGPKSRKVLAEETGYGAVYRLLYGDWSGLGHANDVRRFLSAMNGRPAFDAVRRPDELQSIAQLSALMLVRAHREMIGKFRAGESLANWLQREIQPLWDKLSSLQVTFTPLAEE